jgi:hypothetical protein
MRAESAIQRAIRHYLAANGYASVHVPNGAVLSGDKLKRAKQMSALKADGLYPGFPDLLVYGPGQRIGHIEVKSPTGAVQDTQKQCQTWLEGLGHHYAICRSIDDAAAALRSWGWL